MNTCTLVSTCTLVHKCPPPPHALKAYNHIAMICAPFFQDIESQDDYERTQEQDGKKHMAGAERDSGSWASRDRVGLNPPRHWQSTHRSTSCHWASSRHCKETAPDNRSKKGAKPHTKNTSSCSASKTEMTLQALAK